MSWSFDKLVTKLAKVVFSHDASLHPKVLSDLVSLIACGFLAVYIQPGENVTMMSQRFVKFTTKFRSYRSTATKLNLELGSLRRFDSVDQLLSAVVGLMYPSQDMTGLESPSTLKYNLYYPESVKQFGHGNDCCVIYPAILDEMAASSTSNGLWMRLQHGSFILNGRSYQKLQAMIDRTSGRDIKTILPVNAWPLKPTDAGKHRNSIMTATERFGCIELRLDVITEVTTAESCWGSHDGNSAIGNCLQVTVDLSLVISRFCALETLQACVHNRNAPFSREEFLDSEAVTYVPLCGVGKSWEFDWDDIAFERPKSHGTPHRHRVAFALTKGCPEAQLFSLAMVQDEFIPRSARGRRYFMQGDCCMSCAFKLLKEYSENSVVLLT